MSANIAAIERVWEAHTAAEFVSGLWPYRTSSGRAAPVAVVGVRDGLIESEHIYWDQASVLAQVGLLDPVGLPVTGVEQVKPLGPDAGVQQIDRHLAAQPTVHPVERLERIAGLGEVDHWSG